MADGPLSRWWVRWVGILLPLIWPYEISLPLYLKIYWHEKPPKIPRVPLRHPNTTQLFQWDGKCVASMKPFFSFPVQLQFSVHTHSYTGVSDYPAGCHQLIRSANHVYRLENAGVRDWTTNLLITILSTWATATWNDPGFCIGLPAAHNRSLLFVNVYMNQITLLLLFPSHLQCARFSVNTELAPRMASAATSSALAVAWNPTQPVTAWPAAASSTRATALSAVLRTTSRTRVGAASPSPSARIFTTDANGRRSVTRAPTAKSTSSTMVPAFLSVPLATRPSTPPRKWSRSNRFLMARWHSGISHAGFRFCMYVRSQHTF